MKTTIRIGKIVIEIETDEEERSERPPLVIIDKQQREEPEKTGNGNGAHLLSARERRILELLGEGLSNKMIALRLCITESTVKVHMKALLRKLRVSNRTQAALCHHNGASPQ